MVLFVEQYYYYYSANCQPNCQPLQIPQKSGTPVA
jgi:hypothetical protein